MKQTKIIDLAAYNRARYAALKAAGLCPRCGKEQDSYTVLCDNCNEKQLGGQRGRRVTN